MFKYYIVFKAKGREGDAFLTFEAPIVTEEDVRSLKNEVAIRVEESGIKCEASEVLLINWE